MARFAPTRRGVKFDDVRVPRHTRVRRASMPQSRRVYNEEEKRALFDAHANRDPTQTTDEFCAAHGVASSLFYRWRRELGIETKRAIRSSPQPLMPSSETETEHARHPSRESDRARIERLEHENWILREALVIVSRD